MTVISELSGEGERQQIAMAVVLTKVSGRK